jgi:hypothetical protein
VIPASTSGRLSAPAVPYAAAGAALALEMTTHLLDFGVYDDRIRLLDSSYEWSWSHLAATAAFAACAAIGARAAVAATDRRRAWGTIWAAFSLLLVDNVTRMHDRIGFWPAIYAPLLLAVCVALVTVARGTERERIVQAGVGLLFGSFVVHVLGPSVVSLMGWGRGSWAYQVKVAIKEGTELAGWLLLVPALAQLAWHRAKIATAAS